MEDNYFEPTNYLESNLVIKEEPVENDNNLVELTKNEIKLEESGSGKDHRGIRGKVDAKSYKKSEPNNGSYICEPCNFRTISPGKWSHHLKSHHKCEDCGKEFNGVNGHRDFKTHLKSHQSKECDVCGKEFNGLKFFRDFKQHLKTHQPKQVFPCSKCDRSFPFLSYLNRHKKRIHGAEGLASFGNHKKSIKMEDIDFEPTNYLETNLVIKEEPIDNDLPHDGIKLEEYGGDIEKVEAKMIFCLKCGDHFEKAEDLYLHVEGNLNCETKENLKFLSKQGQNQKSEEETTEEHSETNLLIKEEVIENDHNLVDTGQPLKNKRGKYKKNKKKVDTAISATQFFKESGTGKSDIRANEQEMVKAKMIFCLKCGDHFEIIGDLSAHVEANLNCKTKPNLQFLSRQERKQTETESSKEENEKGSKKYSKETLHLEFICSFCDKVFKSESALERHLKSFHTNAGEKKKCAMCDYRYHHKSNLIRHIDIVHRGLKDTQQCPICEKEVTKTHLKKHIATVHEGKLPYQCSICSKKFSQKPNWMRHEKDVHSIKHNFSKVL